MFENVSILIPFKPDGGQRDAIFKWVKKFYENKFPGVELCIADFETTKSQGVNKAAKLATKDIFVIADADIIFNPKIIIDAVKLLEKHPWVIPFQKVQYLNEQNTKNILLSESDWPPKALREASEYELVTVGGINVLPREFFLGVGGFDERFIAWGGEDDAFEIAVSTLFGDYARIDCNIYHLWHPAKREYDNPNYASNFELYKKYFDNRNNVPGIRELLANMVS